MGIRIVTTAVLAASLLGGSACERRGSAVAHRELTMSIGQRLAPTLGPAMTSALAKVLPDVTVRTMISGSGTDTVAALQAGTTDLAFVFADTAYLASVGRLNGKAHDQLRGIATLNPNALYVVTRPGVAITSMPDLRGKRVIVGPENSSTALTATIILDALGINVQASHAPALTDTAVALEEGKADAMFVFGTDALEPLRSVATRGGRIVRLTPEEVDQLHRHHPFLRGIVASPGPFGSGTALTIALDRLLVTRSGLDADLAYGITKALFESLPELAQIEIPLQQMNAEEAPGTPIPLHPGAARYYREQAAM